MKGKIKMAFFILLCSLVTFYLVVFDSCVAADSGTPLSIQDTSFKENSTEDMPNSTARMMEETVVLNQTFDGEDVGADPEGWKVTERQHGGLTVDNQTYYGGNASARFVDNSTVGSPGPYRTFPPQSGTIVVTFAIRPTANSGNHTNLIIYVDDGNFSGSNICFTENGTIEYHDDDGSNVLRTYSADVWYEIKLIMKIPNNTYEIYINDHLEAVNATFNKFGVSREIRRITFGEALAWQPIGYIDVLLIRRGIRVPEDYPTIQEAIDAASAGDTVFVESRTYYEYVSIKNKNSLRLIGENRSTTVIDGKFGLEIMPLVSLEDCDNITISRFTVRNGVTDGISISGSRINITDNLIISNLNRGVSINGSNNVVSDNVISSNFDRGLHIEGEGNVDNVIIGNVIENNAIGVECNAVEGNMFYHNRFVCNTVQAIDNGSNKWDIGYGHPPLDYGGNYWSDYNGTDIYSGPYQNDPGRDVIGDTQYVIDMDSKDRYPLYLIETVTLCTIVKEKPFKCEPVPPSYHQRAMITVITTRDVQVNEAVLFFTYNSTWRNETMTISANSLSATIPKQPYWTADQRTVVQYKVNASNVHGVWAASATFNYTVTDTVKPQIKTVKWTPEKPFENQSVTVTATVTEPPKASGVDKVDLSYMVDDGDWWKAEMKYDASSKKYVVTILKQPGGSKIKSVIKASDKAGNEASKELKEPKDDGYHDYTYKVRYLPKLSTIDKETGDEIDSLDFEVMSVGFPKKQNKEIGKTMKFDIKNAGDGTLNWTIREDCEWLSVNPDHGTTPRKDHPTEAIEVTVKTAGLSPANYVCELLVTSNGGDKTLYVYVKVRTVEIDDSWASADRCDVGSNQTIYFHAIWGPDSTSVQHGKIFINKEIYETNNTGCINFTRNFSDVGERIWRVTGVECKYVYNNKTYTIKSYTVTCPDYPVKIVWDRVQITLNVTDDRIDVGSTTNITWTSRYESDNIVFNGYITLNETLIIPFNGSITQKYNTTGKRGYTTTSISDPKYSLTAFTSNPVCCIWDRIRIIGGGVSQAEVYVNQNATVWFIAVYEYDGSSFNRTRGRLFVNGSKTKWSNKNFRCERDHTCYTPGVRTFQVSRINDTEYGLTRWVDPVGPVSIKWCALTETGWLELGFTVDGETPPPTKSATYRVEYPNGTIKTYTGINVTVDNMPVGSYHITCTYDAREKSRDATIKEDKGETVIFDFETPIPIQMEWWMTTIIYTVVAGVIISQFLLLVKRRRKS